MSQPWDRVKGETEQAYDAFLIYRELGPDRTQDGVRVKLGKVPAYLRGIERWAKRWSWAERARAWDNHLQAERDKVAEKAASAEARKWEQRKQAAREANYAIAERLMERAQNLLDLPTVQQRSTKTEPDGQTTVTVWEPAKWTQRDLPTIAKVAADLREVAIYTLEERNARQVVAAVTSTNKTVVSFEDTLSRLDTDDLDQFERLARKMLGGDGAGAGPGDDREGEAQA